MPKDNTAKAPGTVRRRSDRSKIWPSMYYAAAHAYLSLKLTPPATDNAVTRLRKAKLTTRRADESSGRTA